MQDYLGKSRTQGQSVIEQEVNRLLRATPTFRHLDTVTQQAMQDSLVKIASYLAVSPGAVAQDFPATQLEPLDLQRRLARQGDGEPSRSPPASPQPAAEQPATASVPSQSATGRAGDVARATLNAIDFPQFASSLLQGLFQSIVEAHIQQAESYAKLLQNVAMTVDQFMSDNITSDHARDYLADQYDGFVRRDISSGRPRLTVDSNAIPEGEMPSFFKNLGIESPEDLTDDVLEEKAVPAARHELATQRQQTLATMVMLGVSRVMVNDGEISAKLQFHIDASESTKIRFDQNKTSTMSMAGRLGRNPFNAQAIMVNTANLNAQSDINVRADLTGQVKINFKTDAFPLEKFADPLVMQLINQNAKVPAMQPTLAPASGSGTPAGAPNGARTPAAESNSPKQPSTDPWAPR